MKLWLILPVKPFHQGKSRLASILSVEERIAFNTTCMLHLLQTARDAQCLAGVALVSRDPAAHRLAQPFAVHPVQERGHTLNQALEQGRTYAMQHAADAVLVLPTDLPLLQVEDIHTLYELGKQSSAQQSAVILAPSSDGGTNALLLCPPTAIDFCFGRQSAQLHQQQAIQRSLHFHLHHSPTLQIDIDLPEHFLSVERRA